jgi:hypothetical protein
MIPFGHRLAAICLVSNAQLRDDFYVGDQPRHSRFSRNFNSHVRNLFGRRASKKGSV